MFIIVCGGGTIGYNITLELLDRGHEVVVLEKNAARARYLQSEIGQLVMPNDGCEGRWLKEAGVNRADLVCALTDHDEDNLIIAQLANSLSDKGCRIIARVNEPANAAVFRSLGVPETVSATDLVLAMIESEVRDGGGVVHLTRLAQGGYELVQFRFTQESRALNRPLGQLGLPQRGCKICAVLRAGAVIENEPELELVLGDELIALVKGESLDAVREYLIDPEFKVEIS